MVRALYPGSFDPVTRGHIDLVDRASHLFDSVTVAVAMNSSKNCAFSVDERMAMLREVLPAEVQVLSFDGLVVQFCRQQGFAVILRGLRSVADFEYEYQMALTNRHLVSDVETVFVMPSAEYAFTSSTLIKDVLRNGGDVSSFLPESIEEKLRKRLQS